MVKTAWRGGVRDRCSLSEVRKQLEGCKYDLSRWSSKKYGAVNKQIRSLSSQLERLQAQEHPGNLERITRIQQEINLLLEMEDIRWKQRAKRNWLKHGDRNSQFYHAWATQ